MRTVVEQLAGINLEILGEKADDTQIKAAHDRAFDVQAVTDTFYKTFREVFEFTRSRVQGIQNEEQLHLFTQQLFNRLLFLSFIDKKGWLNLEGKGGYFDRLWHNYQAPRKNKSTSTPNFYRERLEPLFFEALNTPHNADMSEKDYADLQSMLQNSGTVPDKAVLEKSGTSPARLKKLEKLIGKTPFLNGGLFEKDEVDKYKELHIPDECFSTIFKKLFAAFNFTVMESTPFDEDVAIDPEMLGRVFEELVVGRHSTGSYYTPKSIVSFMCHEALKGYLESRIPGVDKEALELFVDDYDASKIKSRAEEVLDALRAVTVCDPACGSGAYLLGMLQELIHLRAALFDVAQLDSRTAYKRKLEIIHNNLYGTDLEIFAVNIARLRLWLSLIVEYEGDTPPPLPNLDFKIESGDSLLGPPIQQRSGEQLEFFDNTDKITLLAQGLKKKKEAYLRAQGAIKELVKKGISKQEEAIQKALQDSKFKRRDGKPVIFWHVHFFEVFADGGFDVVLANPPYVRQEQISEEKARLKEVFPEVYSGKADLFCFFYARAVEMLKPGGMFVFISPNKWFKAGYGSGLRTLMKNTCEVRQIIDFNDLPVFKSAVAYPMIFIAKKHEEGVEDFKQEFLFTDVTTLAPPYPDVKELVRQNAVSIPDMAIDEKRWLLMDPSILNKIAKMDEVGVPLKTYLKDCAINRGIVTGFNRAFFINGETRQKLIDEDPRSEEIIKPLIQGKDVKKWHVESRDQWIIFAKQGIDIDQYPAVKSHLAQWKKELTPKPKKASKGKKGRASGTYKWYELQSSIAYEAKLSQTKIVYPVIAQKPCFALDREHHYLNDKAFMIPLDDPYLLGVLNSEAVWFYLKAVCSPLQNNFIELRSPYILNLPVPDASAEEQKHLSGLVSKLLKSKAQTRVKLEQEINSFVDKLYGF
ncbi:MAG: N-6 DNA methylase [Candidatus Hydrogenedens sp.]|nr:N-6 DNA methylase [Candidatus Hydrogenedens sp.]